MEQLILHLIGDYITQTNKMATEKTKDSYWAIIHAWIYGLPFLWLGTYRAVGLIVLTHFLIDRFRLARYVVFVKNKITEPSLKWDDCKTTGYHKDVPAWMSVWLMIIADNTLHLAINYLVLKFVR